MRRTKDQKAITLIALVVTVIVLLILAGVVLHSITGDTSIIDNANYATQKYNESSGGDQNIINQVENLFEKHLGPVGNNEEDNNSGDNNDDDDDDDATPLTPRQQQYGGIVNEQESITPELFDITYTDPGTAVVRHSTNANGVVSRGDVPTTNTEGTATITGINWEYFEDSNFTVSRKYHQTYMDMSTSKMVPASTSYFCVVKTESKKAEIEQALRKLIIPYEVTHNGVTYKVTAIDAELLIKNKVTFGVDPLADSEDDDEPEAIIPTLSGSGDPTSLVIPASVTNIRNMKFLPRDQILLTEGTKTIGENAFSYCKDVKLISIPGTIESIGNEAFAGCGVKEITYDGTTYKTTSNLLAALAENKVIVASDAFDEVELELDPKD